eukprot:TRINITY_DN917_c0_g1_i1.p1 TRINITY_DN917_c0_g1~~TRINITY_DN917_c0_g1_i1.p1  ORF type:complete len:192 (+),score=36.20 TRINITY_DN917_c0_g1_i1:423-998(+)
MINIVPLSGKETMGNLPSGLSLEEMEQLKEDTHLSEKELRRIYRRFKKLDADQSGAISIDEFLTIPELAANPLLERVVSNFDKNKDNEIQFTELVTGLSTFLTKGNQEEKLRFIFDLYDIDADGFISNGELFHVLKMMVGNNLNEVQLQQIVDKTIIEADEDKDGKISFQEFVKMIDNVEDIEGKMTISFE